MYMYINGHLANQTPSKAPIVSLSKKLDPHYNVLRTNNRHMRATFEEN